MSTYDLVIENGTIVDGTGVPRYQADIGIKNGIIENIGSGLSSASADQIIDVKGKIVAPGVIDTHTHYDAQIHWDPYCTSSGWHGTTTVAVGNCGFGFAPVRPEDRERYMLMMENTEQIPLGAMKSALSWDWQTFPEWLNHLKKVDKGVNVANFLPLNPLLIYTMGIEAAKSRPANASERQKMKDILNGAMDAGAIGFGFSYQGETNSHVDFDGTPMPSDTMAVEDAYFLAEVLKERGQGVIQALVDIPGTVNREVALELARASKRPVIHNMTLIQDAFPTFHTDIYQLLDDAEKEGLSLYSNGLSFRTWTEFKVSDYTLWDISAVMREFSVSDDKISCALSPDFRKRLKESYDSQLMAGTGSHFEGFILRKAYGATAYSQFEGKKLGEISSELGTDFIDVFLDIVAASNLEADFATGNSFSEDPVKYEEMYRHKRLMPGISDGGAHPKFASGGYFSTDAIMWMCREEARLSLEEMHFKLSALPAHVLGLHRRGTLIEDNAADLYVYDYADLGYRRGEYDILHDLPDGDWRRAVKAQGIEWIVVNGSITFKNGVSNGNTPGRLIGNGGRDIDSQLMS